MDQGINEGGRATTPRNIVQVSANLRSHDHATGLLLRQSAFYLGPDEAGFCDKNSTYFITCIDFTAVGGPSSPAVATNGAVFLPVDL